MVNIIITNTKESTRFPHKNEKLLTYTFAWLENELQHLNRADVQVWYIMRENAKGNDYACHHPNFHIVRSPDNATSDSHRALFAWLQESILTDLNDTWVQVQLT